MYRSSDSRNPVYKTDARDALGAFLRCGKDDQPTPEGTLIWIADHSYDVWDIYTTLLAGTFFRHYTRFGALSVDCRFSYARHTKPMWFGRVRQPIYRLVANAIFEAGMNRMAQREFEEQLQAESLALVGGEQADQTGIIGALVFDPADTAFLDSLRDVAPMTDPKTAIKILHARKEAQFETHLTLDDFDSFDRWTIEHNSIISHSGE